MCQEAAFIHEVAVGRFYRTALDVDDGLGDRTLGFQNLCCDFFTEQLLEQCFKFILQSVFACMELKFRFIQENFMGSHLSTTKPLRGRVTSSRARTQSHQCGITARERESCCRRNRIFYCRDEPIQHRGNSCAEGTCSCESRVLCEENIPMGQGKWIDIPANTWHQEDARSTEISKFVMRVGRHFDQDEREFDGVVLWDSMGAKLRKAFLKFGSSEFSDSDWLQQI